MQLPGAQILLVLLCLLVMALPATADEIEVSGRASLDVRFYTQSPLFSGQGTGPELSVALSPEFSTSKGPNKFVFAPFYRKDSMDSSRTHFDLRKAYWSTGNDKWSLLVGFNQVSWDVAISHHLINIINQADTVEDVVTEHDRLGQQMINLTRYNDWGQLDFLYTAWLPWKNISKGKRAVASLSARRHTSPDF